MNKIRNVAMATALIASTILIGAPSSFAAGTATSAAGSTQIQIDQGHTRSIDRSMIKGAPKKTPPRRGDYYKGGIRKW